MRQDAACGVELFREDRSPACPAEEYNSRADANICGHRLGSLTCLDGTWAEDDGFKGCKNNAKPMRRILGPKTCQHPSFGVKTYQVCRAPAHGPESYKSCQLAQFGVENYQSCSFYMTPEQLDAYIVETQNSLATYQLLLPSRQGELYSRLQMEGSFGCLVKKYQSLQGFEDIAEDLSDRFMITFGYEYMDAFFDCEATSEKESIQIKVSSLNCDDFDRETITSLVKPDDVSEGAFTRFKQNCSLKKSYDLLDQWFFDRKNEVDLLITDLIASRDQDVKNKLFKLKSDLESN